MKKHNHPIDDFFRETLENHQMVPSEEAKKAFLRDVIKVPISEKKGRRGFLLLSLLLALVGTGIIIWAISSDKFSSNKNPESRSSVPYTTISHQESGPAINHKSKDNASTNNSIVAASITRKQEPLTQLLKQTLKQQSSPEQPDTIQNPAESQNQITALKPLLPAESQNQITALKPLFPPLTKETPDAVSTPENPESFANSSNENRSILNLTPMKSIRQETVSKPPETRPDSIIIPGFKSNWTKPESHVKHSDWIPSLGIYYTPEWMFNTLEGTKFINNFGLEGTFHFGRFSVRTGAGISIGKGTNELIVEYNDYLGAYNKLDSMKFTWNNPEQQYFPKYYMSKQEVWDSLMKQDYNKVVKRYTYLQIPMIMGYDFWQTDRISIGMRVGPVMSVLMSSKQLSAEYDPGNKRVISANDIAPGQVSLNWQAMAGVNTSFLLTKELLFEVEPSLRYYFNSVYEKPDNSTRPWSIGVRAAFVIKF